MRRLGGRLADLIADGLWAGAGVLDATANLFHRHNSKRKYGF